MTQETQYVIKTFIFDVSIEMRCEGFKHKIPEGGTKRLNLKIDIYIEYIKQYREITNVKLISRMSFEY